VPQLGNRPQKRFGGLTKRNVVNYMLNALLWESDLPADIQLGPLALQHRKNLLRPGWRGRIYRNIQVKILTELYIKPMELKPGLKILELGCGEALELFELARLGAVGYGVDIRPDRIDLVNHNAQSLGLEIEGYLADACHLSFETNSFDVVTATSFFEHVHDQDATLSEAVRVLTPGGKLVIRDGNLLDPIHLFDVLVRRPITTKGKVGGINWLKNRGKTLKTVPLASYSGRDEDWKTVFWWQRKLTSHKSLVLQVVSTSITCTWLQYRVFASVLRPFLGGVYIVATKK
jgi:SAM-dependent methyltransferase